MNEKGFFNLIGLCFLLIISLFVVGIQETENNYSYGAINFQTELELQNAADGAVYEAAEKIRLNPDELIEPTSVEILLSRNNGYGQRKISVSQPEKSERLENISVEVFGERLSKTTIDRYERIYSAEDDYTGGAGYKDTDLNDKKHGIILIGVAKGEEKFTKTKKFRRTLAYILDDDEKNIIHFLNKAERGKLRK